MIRGNNTWLRLSFSVLATAGTFAACGGVNSGVINITSDDAGSGGRVGTGAVNGSGGHGMAGSTADAANGGRGGTAGSTADAASDGRGGTGAGGGASGGAGGESEAGCHANAPCNDGTAQGVCISGTCSMCADPADDATCAAAYGAGNLCIAGACVKAQCRTASDCGISGKSCVNNLCTSCTSDGDCATANTVCEIKTGACVANTACGSAANGAACLVNPSDICCGSSGVCVAASCCGTDACKTSPAAASNDGVCKNGQCVLSTCVAPVGTTRYVDLAALAGGSGSKGCPFDTLGAALDDLASTGGTVLIRSDGTHPIPATLAVGSGINLVGVDTNFDACTAATCADPKSWPLLTTGDYRDLNFLTAGPRQLHFLRFQGIGKSTAQSAGLGVSAATVTVDHVDVSGYQFGFYVDTGGTVNIGAGVHLHDNHDGLSISDGGVSSGGAAQITDVTGTTTTDFNGNDYGILVHGNGSLRISGSPWSATAKGLISANDNGSAGIYWASTQTKPAGFIDGLELMGNGVSQTNHDAMTIFAHSVVKVRNTYIHANSGNGLYIPASGTNTADGLSAIDLGVGISTTAGRNTFAANALTGLCIQSSVATTASASSLKADGNIFGTTAAGDCTKAGKFKRAMACTAGIDVSGACASSMSLLNCTASNACQ